MEQSKTLKELTSLALQIEQSIIENDGALSPEIEQQLNITNDNLAAKVDGYAMVIARVESAIEFHKARMKDHAAMITRLEASIDWMEQNLKQTAETLDKTILNGYEFAAKLSLNKPSVDIYDEKLISEEYIVKKVTETISKTKIKEALELGVAVDGARLVSSKRISIGLKKKELK